ncbi:MAG: ATP-binding protein [Alphaproteobacteria bacterium]
MQPNKGFSRSSSFFMASLFAILLLAINVLVFMVIFFADDEVYLDETKAALSAKTDIFTHKDKFTAGSSLAVKLDEAQLAAYIAMHQSSIIKDYLIAYQDRDGNIAIGNMDAWPPLLPLTRDMPPFIEFNMNQNGDQNAMLGLVSPLENGGKLLVARSIERALSAREYVLYFGWVVILITILVGITSFAIGKFVVNKVNSITLTANQIIETGNVAMRIPNDSSWDDLSKLTIVLNHLLEKLENQIYSIKRVSDNIAHDLKTPLTRLRGALEQIKDPAMRQELLVEADTLMAIFNALLRISEIETEKRKSAFAMVKLDILVKDVIEFYEPLADERNISIHTIIEPCMLEADQDILFQSIANVLDNAIKFTPDGGVIDVKLITHKHEITLSIKDSGPGIEDDYKEEVFRRFFRIDPSRNAPGHGLGLSIVKAAVHLHDGRITLINTPTGLDFIIAFN